MLEKIAMLAPAWVLYAITGLCGFLGVICLLIPIIGVPLLFIAYLSFLAAGIARRRAREVEVRRQQGG